MKLVSVVGTRPEIVKMAPVIRACRQIGGAHVLIHTGQHYDFALDEVFFRDLDLPRPDHRLDVGSRPAAEQIAAILAATAPILERERPDAVLVEGDTNSVLAAGLAATASEIPVAHIEAGLRCWDRSMPEETNRRIVDHLAELLFAPTPGARDNLFGEGIAEARIHVTGNTVVDELKRQQLRVGDRRALLARFEVEEGRYALATVHRRENLADPLRLADIFRGLAGAGRALGVPVLAALHPHTRSRLAAAGIAVEPPVRAIPPLGYLEFLGLHEDAALTISDSGGLLEEACCLGVPCVILRNHTERPEAIDVGAAALAGADAATITACAREMVERPRTWANPFGDGKSGLRIAEILAAGFQGGSAAGSSGSPRA